MSRETPETRSKGLAEFFPYPEDWIALQGGKPRVFYRYNHPKSAWKVVHVYEEHATAERRFQSGLIVPTQVQEKYEMLRYLISRPNEDGETIQRDVLVPSFMSRQVHGDLCENRSASMGGGGYDRVTSEPAYEKLLADLRDDGFTEIRFSINSEGQPYMQALADIRPARPLADS